MYRLTPHNSLQHLREPAMAFYHLVRPETPVQIESGLACLMGGPETTQTDAARARANHLREAIPNFMAYAREIGLDPARQVQAYAFPDQVASTGMTRGSNPLVLENRPTGPLVSLCLWVPAPGKTAMLFTPNATEFPEIAQATKQCVEAALEEARAAGVSLVQVVLDPQDQAGRDLFLAAGLQVLATLEYMERRPPLLLPSKPNLQSAETGPTPLQLETYTPENHAAFATAIQESYQETLDCPALSGMRAVEDVIAGHKSVGRFDPTLWFLLTEDAKPLGCLILADIPSRQILDLVYLGLVPAARGRGLGRILMQQLLYESYARKSLLLSVSVDETNTPACKLYHRFGFSVQARRLTMICPLKPTA